MMLNKGDNLEIGDVSGEATVNQVNGDVTVVHNHSGISIGEVVPLVHALVESDLARYRLEALSTAQARLDDFAKSLEERLESLESEVKEKINSFADPAMQFATFEATTGYIKSGTVEEKESLIDLLIERVKAEPRSSLQSLIDDAIKIVPKLSQKSLAVLTLTTYSKLTISGASEGLVEWIKCMNPVIDQLADAGPLDIEYLVQADCVASTPGLTMGTNWIQHNRKNYPLMFSNPIPPEDAKVFLDKYRIQCKDGSIRFLDGLDLNRVMGFYSMFLVNKDGSLTPQLLHGKYYAEALKMVSFLRQEDVEALLAKVMPVSDEEVRRYYENFNPKWRNAIALLDGKCSGFALKPVGIYIGLRQLARLYKKDVPLDIFFK